MIFSYASVLLLAFCLGALSQPLLAGVVPNGLPSSDGQSSGSSNSSDSSIIYDDIGKGTMTDSPSTGGGSSQSYGPTQSTVDDACQASVISHSGDKAARCAACTASACSLSTNKPSTCSSCSSAPSVGSKASTPKGGGNGGGATPQPAGGRNPTPSGSAGTPTAKAAAAGPGSSDASASPNSSTPATGDATADQQTCQSLQKDASSCCMDPTQCGIIATNSGTATSTGLSSTCNQMNQTGQANGNSNYNAANACLQKYTTCHDTCTSLANNYSGDVAAGLNATARACTGLAPLAAALNNQATSSHTAANSGTNCDNLAQSLNAPSPESSSDPNSQSTAANAVNANDPYGCQANPSNVACQSCTNNPSSPACKAMAAAAASGDQPTAGFQAAPTATQDTNFNVASGDGTPSQTQFGNFAPQQAKINTVANNSGGGIPGSGGAVQPASLGNGGARGPSAGSPGYNTDIDQGMRSGGYSQPASAAGGEGNGGGEGANRAAGGGKGAARGLASVGMDLKQYLPGHALDPNGQPGGLNARSAEIGSRFSDLWRKISIRYQEKCRLGELLDCR